jgi:uncharacterized phage protein (TIGR01671 family)
MRTIKFRVWNKKTNNWVEGCGKSDDNSLDGVNLFGETILLGGFMCGVSVGDLNDCVALQYTGLNDRNGKNIYEGDICISRRDYNESQGGQIEDDIGKVTFEYGCFYLDNLTINEFITDELSASSGSCDLEVIGNIFETPELLTK